MSPTPTTAKERQGKSTEPKTGAGSELFFLTAELPLGFLPDSILSYLNSIANGTQTHTVPMAFYVVDNCQVANGLVELFAAKLDRSAKHGREFDSISTFFAVLPAPTDWQARAVLLSEIDQIRQRAAHYLDDKPATEDRRLAMLYREAASLEPSVRAAKAVPAQKERRGRKRNQVMRATEEKRIMDAWKSGDFTTYDECGRDLGVDGKIVKRTVRRVNARPTE